MPTRFDDVATDVTLSDGRTLRVHDSGSGGLPLIWHHGSPQTGALLRPLQEAAAERGLRLMSFGRPSYGGSSANRGRSVASIAADLGETVDALGIDRFATIGHSGGGPPALATAAHWGDRVVATVALSSLAPYRATEEWFAGMAGGGPSLRAALLGRDAYEQFERTTEFDPSSFNALDHAALDGPWSALGDDVGVASADGPEGITDDDLSFVQPWGFDPSVISTPVLLVHGGDDRVVPAAHSAWLHELIPGSELWLRPADGHVSILRESAAAMDWVIAKGQV
jgi:pimeloyl-ACP methyl ester carboxylesterase